MRPLLRSIVALVIAGLHAGAARLRGWTLTPVHFGRCLARVPAGSLVFFPLRGTCFGCGIAGIVTFKRPAVPAPAASLADVERLSQRVQAAGFAGGSGDEVMELLWQAVQGLKRHETFGTVFADLNLQHGLERLAEALGATAAAEARQLEEQIGRLPAAEADRIAGRIERLRDIVWSLTSELLDNVRRCARCWPVRGVPPGRRPSGCSAT